MKKFILSVVAIFAMGTAAFAQDAFDVRNEMNGLNEAQVKNVEAIINSLAKSDVMDAAQIGDIDLTQMQDVTNITESGAINADAIAASGANRVAASLLAIFLGDFGIHHFYTGDTKHGLWHLVFFWCGIPGLIGLIEGIMWLVDESTYPDPLFNI